MLIYFFIINIPSAGCVPLENLGFSVSWVRRFPAFATFSTDATCQLLWPQLLAQSSTDPDGSSQQPSNEAVSRIPQQGHSALVWLSSHFPDASSYDSRVIIYSLPHPLQQPVPLQLWAILYMVGFSSSSPQQLLLKPVIAMTHTPWESSYSKLNTGCESHTS